jgi:hypothetical protein
MRRREEYAIDVEDGSRQHLVMVHPVSGRPGESVQVLRACWRFHGICHNSHRVFAGRNVPSVT